MSVPEHPICTFEEITPELASQYLASNPRNRIVRKPRVAQYARDMRAGKWRPDAGETIKFNGTSILDGQHRLLACVKSGTSFWTFVVREVSISAHHVIDTGLPRSMADEMRWQGIKDASNSAAILNLLWRVEQNSAIDASNPTRSELVPLLHETRDLLLTAASRSRSAWVATRVPTSSLGVVYMRMDRIGWGNLTDEWFDHLILGTGYQERDPALLLRNYAMRVKGTTNIRPNQLEWLAITVKATNLWLTGQTTRTHLRWRRFGHQAEAFPTLITPGEIHDVV